MKLLGVDIGGTKIAAGIVDSETGVVLYSGRTPTNAAEGGAAILERAISLARDVVSASELVPEAVGIGAGGQIDYRTGVVLSATDILPGWAGTQLASRFSDAFGVQAWADNDVNAFAQGEYRFGAGRGANEAVFIALGTGVGGAIVIGGKLHRGKRGTGGELGHMVLADTEGDSWYTFEGLTRGDRLVELYRFHASSASRQGLPGRMELPEPITGAMVGAAAKANPLSDAGDAVRALGVDLGMGLASLANVLDTERFVIGGGLSDLGDLLLEPARESFARHVLPIYSDTVILPAKLGTDSSIVGSACVALVGILEKQNA